MARGERAVLLGGLETERDLTTTSGPGAGALVAAPPADRVGALDPVPVRETRLAG